MEAPDNRSLVLWGSKLLYLIPGCLCTDHLPTTPHFKGEVSFVVKILGGVEVSLGRILCENTEARGVTQLSQMGRRVEVGVGKARDDQMCMTV